MEPNISLQSPKNPFPEHFLVFYIIFKYKKNLFNTKILQDAYISTLLVL